MLIPSIMNADLTRFSSNTVIPNTLILGVGNFLMGDEGVGIHIIHQMENEEWPEQVALLDGGTGGFHLLSHLDSYPRVIMVDATMDGQPAGSIRLLRPKGVGDFPPSLSAHDIGLRDLVASLILLDRLPEVLLVTISVTELRELSVDLSEEVAKVIPAVIQQVRELLEEN